MSSQLSFEDGKFLLRLAREAVSEFLETGQRVKAPADTPRKLMQMYGVFVTIESVMGSEKKLRGCIGHPYPVAPLAEAVIENAISSATEDPRFSPISISEMNNVVFEVSVLTSPEQIKVGKPHEYSSRIKIGSDGLIVERGSFKGLLLPQVPVKWQWDEQEFLGQCCMKAGLTPDCWLIQGTKIFRFSCVVAQELEPNGKVRIITNLLDEYGRSNHNC